MIAAETLIKHTAKLRWVDAGGRGHAERHAAWTARIATTSAYRRARSMMLTGEARAFRIEHHEQVFADGEVVPFPDPLAIPAYGVAA
jgi:hypothetical protein